jgi:YggT family protein
MCELYKLVGQLLQLYGLLMLVYALISWVPSLRGKWTEYVAMAVEPVLLPVRRIIPPIGGIDISFMIVFIIIQLVASQSLGMAYRCIA